MKLIPESGSIVHASGRKGLRLPSSPSSGCIVSPAGNNWTEQVVPGVIAILPNDRQTIAKQARIFVFDMVYDVGYGSKCMAKKTVFKINLCDFCAKMKNRTKIAQKHTC